jgi:transcriptional regulator with XRE-family HTH domain
MSDRSLIATPEGIQQAKIKLIGMRLTQTSLAKRLGIDRQTVNKFFRNKTVSNDYFVQICDVKNLFRRISLDLNGYEKFAIP